MAMVMIGTAHKPWDLLAGETLFQPKSIVIVRVAYGRCVSAAPSSVTEV
jgi:hypothetical protein